MNSLAGENGSHSVSDNCDSLKEAEPARARMSVTSAAGLAAGNRTGMRMGWPATAPMQHMPSLMKSEPATKGVGRGLTAGDGCKGGTRGARSEMYSRCWAISMDWDEPWGRRAWTVLSRFGEVEYSPNAQPERREARERRKTAPREAKAE